ncbi:MAG: GlpG protein [Parasphingorhabdus sp.]|jgi:GlpG protein
MVPGFHPKLTYVLIAICVLVAVITRAGDQFELLRPLLITNFVDAGLPEFFEGQIWRLITPIFIHFGLLHIGLNMIWLWQLGRLIEYAKGPLVLLTLVFITGIGSNMAEFYASGPLFGGMSGVIFALLGYLWVQGKFNPLFAVRINPKLFNMVMIWFVVCWSGVLEIVGVHIANWAHTTGLLTGIAVGFIATRLQSHRI